MSESQPSRMQPPSAAGDEEAREECYRVISELAQEFAYADRVEPDGTIVPEWITAAFTRITGYSREELISRPQGFVLVHQDDLPVFERHVEAALAGEPDVTEVRIVTKSGEVRWIHSRIAPVWDEARERVIRIHGTAHDITQRKQAEGAVELHASVFDGLPFAVYVWHLENPDDPESFRLVAANPATSVITGVPAESVIGKTFGEVFPDMLGTDVPGMYRSVIQSGEKLDLGVVRFGHQRLRERVFSVRAFPLPNSSVGVSFEDVSDSHSAWDLLWQTEQTLERVVQGGPSAVLVFRVTDGRILDVNEDGVALFGYDRSQMLDTTPLDLSLWAHASDCVIALQQVRATGKSVAGHGAFRRRNGETFHSTYSLEAIKYQDTQAVMLMLTEAPERRSRRRNMA